MRVLVAGRPVTVVERGDARFGLGDSTIADLLRLPIGEMRRVIDAATDALSETQELLAPVDAQEVWAAGVTYERSHAARVAESGSDVYTRVYHAERPEIFFKARPQRVVPPGGAGRLRRDSTWDACEPELAVLVNARREIAAYGVADDITSRSIEAENPLYLPQAKIYDDSCLLGHAWTPAWDWSPDDDRVIRLRLLRGDTTIWSGESSTGRLRRRPEELVDWLFRETTFEDGVVLLTGTGIIPPDEVVYNEDDVVEITIDGLPPLVHGLYRAPG
jgi:2-dehydro-3-deoxy-D-arabinonate dehydratase